MTATGQNPMVQPPPNMIAVQVVARQHVAADAVSLFLALPRTQRPPAGYYPGQFVSLAIPTPTETLYRSYSLCGYGSANDPWEITIKRVHKGRISNYLMDQVPVGSLLYVSMPRGTFTLPAPLRRDVPIIFVAAGSGITPIRGMLRALARVPATHRPQVQLHYASHSPETLLYRQEFAQMDPQMTWLRQYHYLSSLGKSLTAADVAAYAGPSLRRAHWYICGPDALRRDMQTMLTSNQVPIAQQHVEVFATQRKSATGIFSLGAGRGRPVAQMTIQATQAALDVRAGETVLDALERHGYQPDFSCRTGTCGTCKLRLLAGRVDQSHAVALTHAERSSGYILSCVAKPLSDITLLNGGRVPTGRRGAIQTVRGAQRAMVRTACTAAVGLMLFGTWQLTDHRPASWGATAAAAPTATQPIYAPPTNTPNPTDTPSPTDTPFPTATPVFGDGGGAPTATPQPPPTPTVVTSPSQGGGFP
jgi:3-ketosteroid 9alpha-monooxygenase subunit B